MDDGKKEEHGGGTHSSPSLASAKLAAASRWGRHDEDRRQGHAPIHRPGGLLNHPGHPSTVPSSVFLTGANGDGGGTGDGRPGHYPYPWGYYYRGLTRTRSPRR